MLGKALTNETKITVQQQYHFSIKSFCMLLKVFICHFIPVIYSNAVDICSNRNAVGHCVANVHATLSNQNEKAFKSD